jgi:hypothetical protein
MKGNRVRFAPDSGEAKATTGFSLRLRHLDNLGIYAYDGET